MHDVGEFVDGHMRVEYAQSLGGNGRVVAGVRLELLEHGIKYVATKELALVAPSVIQGEHDLGIGKNPLPKQNPTIDVDAIPTLDPVCSKTCGTVESVTVFDQQWQREVKLC